VFVNVACPTGKIQYNNNPRGKRGGDFTRVQFHGSSHRERGNMPNTKSAKKRLRQNLKRRLRNRMYRGRVRAILKQIRAHLEEGNLEEARALLPRAYSMIDRARRAGVFHPRKAARLKSRLSRRLATRAA